MGNVFAAAPGPIPGMVPPPSMSGFGDAGADKKPEAPTSNSVDPHPGSFEDLHKNCKDVFPSPFEGAKLMVNKGLSNHFQVSHTLTMSSMQPSGYRFGCTYVGSKQFSPVEAFPVMIGDIDPNGNLNANIIHQFTKNIRTKFVSQIQSSKWVASQLTVDYRGDDFTSSVTLGNPDIVNESGVIVAQYLQKVTPALSLGGELLYQYGGQVPGGEISILTLAGNYTAENWQLSANLTPSAAGVHACYYHKISEVLQVGCELETSLRMQESTATLGYKYEIPKANLQFKAQLDTNWCVAAVLEKKLLPLPFTFALSGYANHVKSQYRFGIGMYLG